MKTPKGSIQWANMSGRFQNTECSICPYGLKISGSACEEDDCLVDVSASKFNKFTKLIKILEVE